ncbi:riboflavin kinase [Hypoxylon fragiforme]|uniref:riboflavin kinase n=1 Tax=Hypoxylon fragiforme TaxID=63214 RepID=UPI0020C5DCE4|nr:riboflavin kinase [Hypoxylon fragiforme]KAI2610086.1 riboflavin kinase [Hypoxylon fragiforme]
MTEQEDQRPRILYPSSGPSPPFPLQMEGVVISGFGRGSKELGIPTANLPVDEAATPWIADAKSGVYFGWASLALPGDHPDRRDQQPRHRSNPRAPPTSSSSPSSSATPPPRITITSSSPSSSNPDGSAEQTTTTLSSSSSTTTAETEAPASTTWQIYPMVMSIGYNPFYKNSVRSAEVHVLHDFAADFYSAPLRLLVLGFVRDEQDYASLDALVRDINIDCDVARQSLARPGWTPRQGTVDGATGEFDGSWLVR